MTVAEYYKALLMDETWETLAQLSTESAMTTFENTFQGTYFHFLHYGMANDCSPMRDGLSWDFGYTD